jgi:putative Mn2+ efflux pump MntP
VLQEVKIAILNTFAASVTIVMDFLTLIAIALGLSFDTFAVSLTCGAVEDRIAFRSALRVAIVMAFFQGGFTVAGYFAGAALSEQLASVDHWVAFGLLTILGVRMVINGSRSRDDRRRTDITSMANVVTMSVGTSIDALAVGVSFAFLSMNIWIAGIIIGIVTFLSSMIAIRIGKSAGKRSGPRIEILGGLILVAIGIRILVEHLSV